MKIATLYLAFPFFVLNTINTETEITEKFKEKMVDIISVTDIELVTEEKIQIEEWMLTPNFKLEEDIKLENWMLVPFKIKINKKSCTD